MGVPKGGQGGGDGRPPKYRVSQDPVPLHHYGVAKFLRLEVTSSCPQFDYNLAKNTVFSSCWLITKRAKL